MLAVIMLVSWQFMLATRVALRIHMVLETAPCKMFFLSLSDVREYVLGSHHGHHTHWGYLEGWMNWGEGTQYACVGFRWDRGSCRPLRLRGEGNTNTLEPGSHWGGNHGIGIPDWVYPLSTGAGTPFWLSFMLSPSESTRGSPLFSLLQCAIMSDHYFLDPHTWCLYFHAYVPLFTFTCLACFLGLKRCDVHLNIFVVFMPFHPC